MPDVMLTLLCPPSLEEPLLDLLLTSDETAVFTSAATAAHGLAFGQPSSNEQVLGRTDAVQVQVVLSPERSAALIDELRRQYPHAGLRYWSTPVLGRGEIE